ncbi:DNA cytosine methyltransferase [Nesterenkonia sp. YGD6]|uniref:DNA cytosine methyltransferase n=1 Tax=Nesterenkonia sp. YGD6 TaxID=2901231 RepID=UPI00406C4962
MILNGIELFAGGGGLLLGSSMAGIQHTAAVEWDRWACDSLEQNRRADYSLVRNLEVIRGDVRAVDWSAYAQNDIDVVSGGPPCQPFSTGGRARAADDPRDMFPAMTEAIAAVQPRAFVVENVRGLTRATFHEYFKYIQLRLQHPMLRASDGESWTEHLRRLEAAHAAPGTDLQYNLVTKVVNAADYGVPQHRHRVFLIGFRSDIEQEWTFPQPTHSGAALLATQVNGYYWARHQVPSSHRENVLRAGGDPTLKPWLTVRDAIEGLPEPDPAGSRRWMDHVLQPGARTYPGHTGSPIDSPSKALKAGGHGVPGGENMIRYPDGNVRYFTVREAARMQTFPDGYALHGSWGEVMRQIGNAVPVELARVVMESVANHLRVSNARAKAVPDSSLMGVA